LSGKAVEELEDISMTMYKYGEWPEEFCESIILPIKKKPSVLECKDYRTLSLIPPLIKNNAKDSSTTVREIG